MVLPTHKKARLSATSLSKSLNIDDKEARRLLAELFNFKSWDAFINALPTQEPQVAPTALNSTHQFMAEKLSDILQVDQYDAILALMKSISPFSNKPKAYRVDLEAIRDRNDDAIDFGQLREMVGLMGEGTADENMMASLKQILSMSGDPELKELQEHLEGTTFDDFQNRMRISHPIDPWTYVNLLDGFLEWNLKEYTEDDIPDKVEFGEPSFYWLDENDEEHPVFANSIVVSPGDSKDEMFLSVLDAISDGFDEYFEKPILLLGNPVFKTFNNKRYSVIGVWNSGKSWRWLFLSKLKPWEQLQAYPESTIDGLENSLDTPPPPESLAEFTVEDRFPASLVYHSILKPTKEPEFGEDGGTFAIEERYEMKGVTGWSSYV